MKKTWEKPEMVTLNVNETAEGAKTMTKPDNSYFDETRGEFITKYAVFQSGDTVADAQ